VSWQIKTLADYFDITSSKRVFQSEWKESGVPFYRAREIVKLAQDGFVENDLFISEEMYQEYKEKYGVPSAGDLLVTGVGTLGKVYVVKEGDRFYFKDGNIIWLKKRSDIDSKYVDYVFKTPSVQNFIQNSPGATVGTYTIAKAKETEVPVPPLSEQKRIAIILDKADALRAKRRESIVQLDKLLQSTFLDMFGDPVTNTMGWEVKALKELGILDRGVSKHRPRNEPSLLGGLHPFIQTGDVSNSNGYIKSYTSTYSDLGLKQSKMWPAGTLCITIAANIANTGVLTFDACFPDSVVGFLSEEKGRSEYVQGLFWFFKDILDKNAPQVAQKNINLKILRDLHVPFPPISLQHRFAAITESIEQQKNRQREHLAELDRLFASLQSLAFKGEL